MELHRLVCVRRQQQPSAAFAQMGSPPPSVQSHARSMSFSSFFSSTANLARISLTSLSSTAPAISWSRCAISGLLTTRGVNGWVRDGDSVGTCAWTCAWRAPLGLHHQLLRKQADVRSERAILQRVGLRAWL